MNWSNSFTYREYRWTNWKQFQSKRNLVLQFNETDSKYEIWGYNTPEVFVTFIYKNNVPDCEISQYSQEQNDADKLDFEINYKNSANQNITDNASPFSSKTINGYKLFRRKHGSNIVIAEPNETIIIDIVIPYDLCKIDKIEVIGANNCDTADLKVYDTPNAQVQINSGVPEAYRIPGRMLNQFGFNVVIPENFYEDSSKYDADLIKGMRVEASIKNNSDKQTKYGVNFTLHEVK